MRQEVNLYRPLARPAGWMTTQRMGQIAGAVAVLLLFHTIARSVQLNWINREAGEMEGRREQMVTRLEESKRSDVAPQVAALREELARAALTREQRVQVLERLKTGGFGNLSGFSPLLQSFARQRVDGMWFTDVRLAEGGSQMLLAGYSMADTLVPDFLQKLHDEAPLAGVTFRHILLRRVEHAEAPIAFELSTEARETGREREKRP